MMYYSAADMYEIDRFTIEEVGIPSVVLMERAAFGVFQAIDERLSVEDAVLIIAGPGNNGGDGIALGRMLHLAGYSVTILLAASSSEPLQTAIARRIGVPMIDSLDDYEGHPQMVVDALLGIGVNRPADGHFKDLIDWMNQTASPVLALDTPSGFSATTGTPLPPAVKADVTYTIGFYKLGMDNTINRPYFGNLQVVDIGYPVKLVQDHLQSLKPEGE